MIFELWQTVQMSWNMMTTILLLSRSNVSEQFNKLPKKRRKRAA